MRMVVSSLVVVLSLVTSVFPAHAQSTHAVPVSALEAAVLDHVSSQAADRDVVLRLLARPDVEAIAGGAGIDLRRVEGAVGTLEGEQLAEVAAQARQAEQALAGGQSRVVISTTAIIIGLLIVILLIVAID